MASISSEAGLLLVEPGRSASLAAAVSAVHGLAMVAAAVAPLDSGGRVLLGALIALGLADTVRVHVLRRGRAAVRAARWLGGADWTLTLGNGHRTEACLAPGCLVIPALVVLRFSLGRWRRRTLILPADALPSDVHRRLRTLLLRGGSPACGQGARGE